ncbi:MAG: helix-turn-helix transcriptional regulator [Clostridia bacterium]|nr:helix-turn-helix transcriptional regulator [Clostridia bacterium]
MDNRKIIGQRLKNYRKSLNIPRFEFCDRAGISSRFLSDIETGKSKMSAETLYNICKAFDVDANYLLFGTERKTVITPLDSLIQQIPEQYSNLLEQSVEMLLETIRIAESCRQDNEKDI